MHTQCDNCNAEWIQNAKFCYQCGQDHHRMPINFKHFVLEFLESTLHFETKNFRMVKLLFTNPGLIIKEFNENKRARYVNPLRLYIFLGFIFFMSTHINKNQSFGVKVSIQNSTLELKKDISETLEKDSVLAPFLVDYKGNLSFQAMDSIAMIHNTELSIFQKLEIKFNKNLSLSKGIDEDFKDHILKYIYNSMLVLIPIFAFIVLILVGYKRHYYQSALVYALYIHCLIYIILSLKNVLTLFLSNIFIFSNILIVFYVIYSLKNSFSLSWRRAILSTFLLVILYLFLLFVTSIGILFYIILTSH